MIAMLTETDINLLEAYLDDALSASEVQSLDARLTEEPEMASSLDSLRAERKMRIAALSALTPTQQQADDFSEKLLNSVRRSQWTRRWIRGVKIGASIAACLIVGFTVGWIGHGHGATTEQMATHLPQAHPQDSGETHPVIDMETARYQVSVLDEKGKVIATQRFQKIEDVRRFVDDATKQTHQQHPSVATPGTKLTEPGSSRNMRHAEPGRALTPATTQPTK